MWTLLLLPLAAYLAIVLALYFAQTLLLFPAGQVRAAGPPPPGAERLEIAAASGELLRGIRIPPRASGARLLILGFGGNAWNAEAMAMLLADIFPEADVVVFHYRGYAPSEGRPGAAALQRDALAIHDFARERFRPARVIAIGFSVGGGVAASLAAHRPLGGLVLVTPFDSLARLAGGRFPWLPVRLLLRHRMEPAADLRGNRTPVALIAGGRDTLVPGERTDGLRRAVANLAFDRTIAQAGHNDIYAHPGFRPAMREALERLGPQATRK